MSNREEVEAKYVKWETKGNGYREGKNGIRPEIEGQDIQLGRRG